jgi:hypothetical protein
VCDREHPAVLTREIFRQLGAAISGQISGKNDGNTSCQEYSLDTWKLQKPKSVEHFGADRTRLHPECPGQFRELEDFNAPLARLDLPDKGIRAFEFGGELTLGQSSRLASFNNRRNQSPLARASQVVQVAAPKLEAILLSE